MTEAVKDCLESNDVNVHLSNNNIGFQSHLFTNHQEPHIYPNEIDQISITKVTSEELNSYDGITEVINPNPNELQFPEVNETLSSSESKNGEIYFTFAKDVSLDIKLDGYEEMKPPNHVESLELRKPVETPANEVVDFSEVHITELRHQIKVIPTKIDQKQISNHEARKPLVKMKVINEDSDYTYQGVSERIKKLVTTHSLDSECSKPYNPKSSSQKNISLTETRKLSMDPQFERKMNELYSPVPGRSVSVDNNGSSYMRNSGKPVPHRLDMNCEVIEENLSPVSETARHLQQQLSFPSSPISPDRSPRIPKTSRFSRLQKLLEQTSESEVQVSPATAPQNYLNS